MDVREKLVELLSEYFDIGDSYAYNLTRVKSAFACGTMGFDDFEEFDEETVEDIATHLIAHGVTVQENCKACAEATQNCIVKLQEQIEELRSVQEWISVKDRLPEPETEVMILAEYKTYSFKGTVTTRHIMTTGMYEDGSKNTEDSEWHWETDGFEYDEELDAHIIPEGWWEYKHYNGDDEYNHPIDDIVTHWMPLPQPPKGERDND